MQVNVTVDKPSARVIGSDSHNNRSVYVSRSNDVSDRRVIVAILSTTALRVDNGCSMPARNIPSATFHVTL